MEMKCKKVDKVNLVKNYLFNKGIFFNDNFPNGQMQVDRVNLWATTEKWHDPKTGTRGQGINSFIKFLKDNCII